MTPGALPTSIDDTQARLLAHDYVCDRQLATAIFLALRLQRPLFLEGEPGTGKTEIAKTLAAMLGRPLIRLQCHEGLDLAGAAYEWNYARQMMEIRLAEAEGRAREGLAQQLFSEQFLIKRALLQAIDPNQPVPPVLLIDELDRADEPFEAFLLEVLSDFQVSVPEIGTIVAKVKPLVFLTSNNTREMSDALKRRCLHLHIPFPEAKVERAILERRVPGLSQTLNRELVAFVQAVRAIDLKKQPSVSETIDWAKTLLLLNAEHLSLDLVRDTLNVFLKFEQDIASATEQLPALLAQARKDAELPLSSHHASHA